MRTVTVNVISTDEKKPVDAEYRIEVKKNDVWSIDKSFAVTSGKDSERKFLLNDNERLVIEARGLTEMVFDPVQNATMTREAFESQPTPEQKVEMEKERQKEVKATEKGQTVVQMEADKAAEIARDKTLEEQKAKMAEKAAETKKLEEAKKLDDAKKTQEASKPSPAVTSSPSPKPTAPAHTSGGMTASGPSTGGQSSKDVK